MSHLVCGVGPPIPGLHETLGTLGQTPLVFLALLFGVVFGLMALLLIETLRATERLVRRFEANPYAVAAAGGLFLALFYRLVGDRYAGLGSPTITEAMTGVVHFTLLAFLWKIVATAVTLETGGSGGIVTPLFFIGAAGGAALAQAAGRMLVSREDRALVDQKTPKPPDWETYD